MPIFAILTRTRTLSIGFSVFFFFSMLFYAAAWNIRFQQAENATKSTKRIWGKKCN